MGTSQRLANQAVVQKHQWNPIKATAQVECVMASNWFFLSKNGNNWGAAPVEGALFRGLAKISRNKKRHFQGRYLLAYNKGFEF